MACVRRDVRIAPVFSEVGQELLIERFRPVRFTLVLRYLRQQHTRCGDTPGHIGLSEQGQTLFAQCGRPSGILPSSKLSKPSADCYHRDTGHVASLPCERFRFVKKCRCPRWIAPWPYERG